MRYLIVFVILFAALGICQASDWAQNVVSYSNLGYYPYNLPGAVLGKPATLVTDPGDPPILPGVFHVSMVYGAWNLSPEGNRIITTLRSNGHITVEFDPPIYDDPDNWYGKDFIVFGNSAFTSNMAIQSFTNMELCTIKNGLEGIWEPMTVSVSQDGVNWYSYSNGPYADDFAPANPFAWDCIEDTWGPEMDFTKPVPAQLGKADFAYKTVADAIDLYKGSAGGTAFDISQLDLPVDPSSGRKWIKYIRVRADVKDEDNFIFQGEIDGFARVGHSIPPITIGQAKKLPDGTRVILNQVVVSASAFETGRLCYIQQQDRSNGIALLGRVLERGQVADIFGIVDTLNDEKVIRCTGLELSGTNWPLQPLFMPVKSIGNADAGVKGLSNTGLLVRTAGRVSAVNASAKTFDISDGSNNTLKCIAPRLKPLPGEPANPTNYDWGIVPDTSFVLPELNSFVTVTGISSIETSSEGLISVLRLRDQDDLIAVSE